MRLEIKAVTKSRFSISNPKARPFLWLGRLILLGAMAWGAGWMAHALLDTPTAPSSTTKVQPTNQPSVTTPPPPSPSLTPSVQTTPNPTAIPAPTATLNPTSMPSPSVTDREEIVQQGEGLYAVCRRHCPDNNWPDGGIPADLQEYAEQTAQDNNLIGTNPNLGVGQRLNMPPCPRRFPF